MSDLKLTKDRRGQWRLFARGRRVPMQPFLVYREKDGEAKSCPWFLYGIEPAELPADRRWATRR